MSPGFLRQIGVAKTSVRALAVRAMAALAFLVTVLLPLRASAVIIPTCEHDAVTRMPIILETSCEEQAAAAIADGIAAPICDPSGASAVAPPRLLPISDARIEAVPGCGDMIGIDPMVGPRSSDHPAMKSPAILDQAMLAGGLFVPPAPFLESVDPLAPVGGPRDGIRDDVYHPPR